MKQRMKYMKWLRIFVDIDKNIITNGRGYELKADTTKDMYRV